MIKKKLQEAVNEQIQAELQSAYLYLGYSAWFESQNLEGFAHWMQIQWEEEIEHAMKFYNHVLRRDGEVELLALDKPKVDLKGPEDAFDKVLKHEQHVTELIHNLYDLAQKENDYPLQTLLHWFIDEQVEEEESARHILEQIQLVGDSGANLYLLDQELGQRPAGGDAADGGGEQA